MTRSIAIRLLSIIFIIISLTLSSLPAHASAESCEPEYRVFLPLLQYQANNINSTAIVIDHTTRDLAAIPPYWIEQAKQLTLHYAHTSHGSQVIDGVLKLADVDPTYAVAVRNGGTPELPTGPGIRIYDGNNPDQYISPDLYWSEAWGINKTRSVVSTNLFDFSMWSWCTQQTSNDTATVQKYLNQMQAFEQEFSTTRVILMTGVTAGGLGTDGLNDTRLEINNQMVRDFAIANNMILFDVADMEVYDPDGNYHPEADDSCPWCADYCSVHPDECANLVSVCAHTHPLMCKLKANAFWWMMARLAGWDGK